MRVPLGFPLCDLKPGEERDVVQTTAMQFSPTRLVIAPIGLHPSWYRLWAKILRFFFIQSLAYVENPEWSTMVTKIHVGHESALATEDGVTAAVFLASSTDCGMCFPPAEKGVEFRIGLKNVGKRPIRVAVTMIGSSTDPSAVGMRIFGRDDDDGDETGDDA